MAKLTLSEQAPDGDTSLAKAGIDPRGDPNKILRLAIPVSLESVFQIGFNLIDQVIVGRLGADAVAAVGLSNSIASIALLLYASAGVGAGVIVARAFGRKDLAELSRVAATGHALAGILGLLTALLVVAFSEPLLRLVGADQKLAGTTDPYFRLYAISVAPMTLSAVTSAVFRSINAPRIPLVITIAAVLLNTGLGLVLVPGSGTNPLSWGSRGGLGYADFPDCPLSGVDHPTLFWQKRRTLDMAAAGFENGGHGHRTYPVDRTNRCFRGALGNEHLHLRSGLYPTGYQCVGC